MGINSYKDLIVWQKAVELVIEIYKLSDNFPKTETYGLVSQIRRASVSIPANIAEGSKRSSIKEYKYFLRISYGSGAEIETFIEIIKRLPFGISVDFNKSEELLTEIMKMLNSLQKKL